jgi:hypothetical protein
MAGKSEASWRKSSHSGDGANCVEVGQCSLDATFVRDSKDNSSGQLVIHSASWLKFVDRVKNT